MNIFTLLVYLSYDYILWVLALQDPGQFYILNPLGFWIQRDVQGRITHKEHILKTIYQHNRNKIRFIIILDLNLK